MLSHENKRNETINSSIFCFYQKAAFYFYCLGVACDTKEILVQHFVIFHTVLYCWNCWNSIVLKYILVEENEKIKWSNVILVDFYGTLNKMIEKKRIFYKNYSYKSSMTYYQVSVSSVDKVNLSCWIELWYLCFA